MYQSGRAGDKAKKRKSPAKSGRVGIYAFGSLLCIYLKCMHKVQRLISIGLQDSQTWKKDECITFKLKCSCTRVARRLQTKCLFKITSRL